MTDDFPIIAIGCSWGGLHALSAILDGSSEERGYPPYHSG